jgi:hypothetical protein
MTDEQIAYSIAKLKEHGIVDSGDTLKYGIGAMNEARVKDFFDKMVKAGIVKPDTDYSKAFHPAIREQGRRRRSQAEMKRLAGESFTCSGAYEAEADIRRPPGATRWVRQT